MASDGLIARKSGEWAKDKLYYLERYFDIFNQGMKNLWPRRVYVDLLAGPGRCFVDGHPDDEFDGSPILALKCKVPFTNALFVEADAVNAHALEARVAVTPHAATGVEVLKADCNSQKAITKVRGLLCQRDQLGLLFVDTLGLSDVHFDTLRRITEGCRADLVYTFHVQDVRRNLPHALATEAQALRFDAAFGSSDWESAWLAHLQGLAPTTDAADALTTFFEIQLKTLGYQFVRPLHRPMKNSKNAPLYRLIFASHSERGIDFWKKIGTIGHSGQRDLPF